MSDDQSEMFNGNNGILFPNKNGTNVNPILLEFSTFKLETDNTSLEDFLEQDSKILFNQSSKWGKINPNSWIL